MQLHSKLIINLKFKLSQSMQFDDPEEVQERQE